MSHFYSIAYAIGFRPWERAGDHGAEQLRRLYDDVSRDGVGLALDLGCGTGAHTIALAERGWDALGVDDQPQAVRLAAAAAAKAGSTARFVVGDVTRLQALGLDRPVRLFLDIGCFHGMSAAEQQATAQSVTAVSAPDARLVLLAFQPGRRGPLPHGVSRAAIEAAFATWRVAAVEPAVTTGMPRALRAAAPDFYTLERIPQQATARP